MRPPADLEARVLSFMESCVLFPSSDPGNPLESTQHSTRDALLLEALRWQAEHVVPYGKWIHQRNGNPKPPSIDLFPGLPTDVFRYALVTPYPTEALTVRFETSGTTQLPRGVHALPHTRLYDLGARRMGAHMLGLGRQPNAQWVLLLPSSEEAPHSSLSHMVDDFLSQFAQPENVHRVWRNSQLLGDELTTAVRTACRKGHPTFLLGTAFAFVHGEDQLGPGTFELPQGSFAMQTGGYKGRSREVEPAMLRQAIGARYGLTDRCVVGEYGMTELSSQLYESTLLESTPLESTLFHSIPLTPGTQTENSRRGYVAPPWVRVSIVDPATLAPVGEGQSGLVRIDDLANLHSVCAIQTSDVGRMTDHGLELLGRDPNATARGCSLSVEDVLW